ncbi:hypothetical protein [Marinomonas pollencensis]|uniref:Uncharacterized protein n=1 Tax=Marinomonas pollencensis TaxID=491954 RepID=A0A3E0DS16_9GAMM|nr:hypothetical protein [Marinomonas pollencensis]REG85115.1 hypothetical protein DFP81_103315 [Marinomonas pollencensis]
MIDSNFYIAIITINVGVITLFSTVLAAKYFYFENKAKERICEDINNIKEIGFRTFKSTGELKTDKKTNNIKEDYNFEHNLLNLRKVVMKNRESITSNPIELHGVFESFTSIFYNNVLFDIKIKKHHLRNIKLEHLFEIENLIELKRRLSKKRYIIESTLLYLDTHSLHTKFTLNEIIEHFVSENESLKIKSNIIKSLQNEMRGFSKEILEVIISLEKTINYINLTKLKIKADSLIIIISSTLGVLLPIFFLYLQNSNLDVSSFYSIFLFPILSAGTVLTTMSSFLSLYFKRHTSDTPNH